MYCPFCLSTNTHVKDSRTSDDGSSTRRRRECNKCNLRFTTIEKIQLREIYVIKKNGEKQLFDRDKLVHSIKMAVRKRNISEAQIEEAINGLITKLETYPSDNITSAEVGEMVMEKLKALDNVAYVRFASVYKNFNSTEDFKHFIQNINLNNKKS